MERNAESCLTQGMNKNYGQPMICKLKQTRSTDYSTQISLHEFHFRHQQRLGSESKNKKKEQTFKSAFKRSVYIPSVVFAIGARSEPVNIRFGI
jgi:hypothetical protein